MSTSPTPTVPPTSSVPATLEPPLPNPVPTVTKVPRPGVTGGPTILAPDAPFTRPVTYPDGVRVVIAAVARAVETGHGPGVMAGREFVTFDLRLINGSRKPIDVNQVVVTTRYGHTKQLAAPVYTPSAGTYDFAGTVRPGGSAQANYGFAVPVRELGNVIVTVDFDGLHSSATYSGKVPAL